MDAQEILHKIRKKEDKTKEDILLLKYHESLSTICEVLISESKLNTDSYTALDNIRKIIQETL